ncbi:hypothetical protein WJX84_010590 [Apatococcus fuscideae]|uniref:Uncharacterized protein n=1 Tax=Apatococcus fuscideae TaxID=2026836 RepID=A0AAW1SMU9_9CHLO
MERKGALRLGAFLVLALLALVGVAGYGRQLREDFLHHRMMEAPEDRRALNEVLQLEDVRQRLLAEESASAPSPGSSDAAAPSGASYGSSAPSSSSSSSSTSTSSRSSGSALGGIAGRRLLY